MCLMCHPGHGAGYRSEVPFRPSVSNVPNRNFFNDIFLRNLIPSVLRLLVCAENEVR